MRAVAASEAVFEWTRKYVQERKAFGGVLCCVVWAAH